MQTLARTKTRITPSLHHLFSSAGPSSGLRTLSHGGLTPLPPPHAEPSTTNFPSFSPLNGHLRHQFHHPYDLSLARFFSHQTSDQTFKTHQKTDPRNLNGHISVTLKHEDENDKVNVDREYLKITQLRWGFIRKVYGIVASQLMATAAVSSAVVLNPSLSQFLLKILIFVWVFSSEAYSFLAALWPMYEYKNEYPKNFICLGVFTLMQSLLLGTCCALTDGKIVLEALATTTAAVTSLTGYTFWAAKRGKDFSYLGPILFPNLIALATISLINMLVYPVPGIDSIAYNAFGALVFTGYMVYDTDNLIKRYKYDEYISASINLYLQVLNLFVRLMKILQKMKK